MVTKEEKIRILLRFVLTLISLVVLVFATIAWFASNDTAGGGGMQLDVSVSPSLAVAKTAEEIKTMDPKAPQSSVTFTPDPVVLVPARHSSSTGCEVGLEYNSNPEIVSDESGLGDEGSMEFSPVPVDRSGSKEHYYIEYTVYVAATIDPMRDKDLVAYMNAADDDPDDTHKACTMDYYVNDVYVGRTNLAGEESLTIHRDEIPLNTSGSLKIVMRSYFDGGLTKEGGTEAYVRSSAVSTEQLGVSVSFVAEDR